jgi:hypothetical protein
MIDKDLIKHAREFIGYLRNFKYERSDTGIEFPSAKVTIRGEYEDDEGRTPNLLPTEGMNHILMAALKDTAKLNSFYVALYSGNYTPVLGLTAATFTSAATELTSSTEGYSEATRQLWVPGTAAGGILDAYDNKANFTIATATAVTIRGAALLSDNVKGSTSGVIISAAKFSSDRVKYDDEIYSIGYRVYLQ